MIETQAQLELLTSNTRQMPDGSYKFAKAHEGWFTRKWHARFYNALMCLAGKAEAIRVY